MATATVAAPARPLAELTIRGIVLGALITVLFTAANVYLGLKVGLTFATSIPAAVISMAVLRLLFNDANILENNIVQTIASAAGTLSAIIFVLPGLIMVGWWQGFPYWTTAADLRGRRHIGRDVLRALAPRARDRIGPALSRRGGGGRSAEGRRRIERRRCGECQGAPRHHLRIAGLGGVRAARRDEARRSRGGEEFQDRHERERRARPASRWR